MEDDSTRGGYAQNASLFIPGDASMISVYDWGGRTLFRKVVNNATHRIHHQFDVHDFDVRSGTGTLFALCAYKLECAVAAALGRGMRACCCNTHLHVDALTGALARGMTAAAQSLPSRALVGRVRSAEVCDDAAGLYVEAILEIDTSGHVIWEWYLSNHVCANCSETTLVDINSGVGHARADWMCEDTHASNPLPARARRAPRRSEPARACAATPTRWCMIEITTCCSWAGRTRARSMSSIMQRQARHRSWAAARSLPCCIALVRRALESSTMCESCHAQTRSASVCSTTAAIDPLAHHVVLAATARRPPPVRAKCCS
jgi:hypothetical protein